MTRKHSIIVGGTKGVGRALAVLFATGGQHVTAVGRTPGEFPEVESGRIEGFVGNAEEPEALLAALRQQVERRGQLSSLVFLQRYRGTGDPWAGEMAVALTATKTLIEGLAPHFAADGNRSVCLVTSNAGALVARNQSLGYHTSKAALRQMARYYAVKYGPQGVRVNVVAPSAFVKPESAAFYDGHPELRAVYEKATPLGRMGTAKEVAQAVAFLCGPDAAFITGQELVVDGGLSLMMQDALAREAAGIA
ncbi:Short-chain dehydrogenase/reductase SDR OS=Desulfovibrio aespoeensis (strain ATCC 700646 / DSM 10631 / Aspo-2) GN=Daes_1968 PE=4 SV=1: adh_short_C2 [Gemmataceae bacterium]|nr:Short-chain dehydrogenase/reductase SDR OS=Desulfovibrio aespoeensis (strain ATCC 700646 / DSM 10631 / Aspo-2) GN=Daes_1968 PE=4 SV=1: adh_short_C2 [Gemmataceae bacterium]VTT99825.1 Short-chain dehydrogenase/reductase SDR OS=Desulfovibrio aespoeensis (strain ATCC 700646 / DSM 10631 / Aspo-2) GN=Daes_1968 PE=4 SV=1: adh_short_C2 [Gemmataceae bacterium]